MNSAHPNHNDIQALKAALNIQDDELKRVTDALDSLDSRTQLRVSEQWLDALDAAAAPVTLRTGHAPLGAIRA